MSGAQAFLDHLAKQDFRVARSRSSGAFVDFADIDRIGRIEDCDWVPASGRATLFSYVIYRRQYHPDFPVPYSVAVVILDEGPRLTATVDAPLENLKIGTRLMAAFDATGRLVFKPANDGAA